MKLLRKPLSHILRIVADIIEEHDLNKLVYSVHSISEVFKKVYMLKQGIEASNGGRKRTMIKNDES